MVMNMIREMMNDDPKMEEDDDDDEATYTPRRSRTRLHKRSSVQEKKSRGSGANYAIATKKGKKIVKR